MDFYLQSNNSYNRLEEEFKKYGKLIFCVDFDDTIYDFHKKGRTYENVISLLHRWEKYSEVIIFTGNGEDKYEMIEQYLKDNNIKCKGVNCDSSVNLPARIRMATLYAVSQTVGGRVANTCNLSEDWVGYATRYGDGAGDFSPLSKLTVTEVKTIGRELNLPSELVDKVPTDGLCGHTDEDNLGFTYDVLDRYIRTGEIDDERTKERIDSMHEKNLFKLQLMPSFEYAVNPQTEVLNNKQTGYDVVSKYIKKYWECHCTEDVIVSIEISRDGKNYERINEVASPYNMYDVEFLNDWWEGERYVRVNGIQGISGIKCENI